MKTINYEGLFNLLADIKHACPVGLSTLTEVPSKKKDNPYGQIFKLNKISAFAGIDYAANMNRALVRKGQVASYDPAPRNYGVHLTSALVSHKNKDYFACRVLKSRPIFLVRSEKGFLKPIEKSKIEHLIAKPKDEIVTYRNYGLPSIRRVRINKEEYKII